MLRHSEPLHDMAGGGGGGKSKADQAKMIFAIVALLIAAVALAWHFGLIGGGAAPAPDSLQDADEELVEEIDRVAEEADLQLQRDLDSGRVIESGA